MVTPGRNPPVPSVTVPTTSAVVTWAAASGGESIRLKRGTSAPTTRIHVLATVMGSSFLVACRLQSESNECATRRSTAAYWRSGSRTTPTAAGHLCWSGPASRSGVSAERRNHHVLLALDLVGHRRCVARVDQCRFPQQRSCVFVERTKLPIEVRRADKEQPSGGHERTTIVFRARRLEAAGRKLRILSE